MKGFTASWLITGNPETPPLHDGAVVMDDDGTVIAVGPAAKLRARYAGISWQEHGGILLPGLVNAHTHLELSHLQGQLPEGQGFVPWLDTLLRLRNEAKPDAINAAMENALEQLEASATVALGEVTNTLAAVPLLKTKSLKTRVFHEIYGLRKETAEVMFSAALEDYHAQKPWPTHLTHTLAPHSLYGVEAAAVQRITKHAAANASLTSFHFAEHKAEREYLETPQGALREFFQTRGTPVEDMFCPSQSALQYALALGAIHSHTLLVHLTDLSNEEIAQLSTLRAPIVLCPRSNAYIESRLPDVPTLLRHGFKPALGTDSLASNHDLDVLQEAAFLKQHYPSIPSALVIAMATDWGAQALGFDNLGSLEPGKKPGLWLLPLTGPSPDDPASHVLEHTTAPRLLLANTFVRDDL